MNGRTRSSSILFDGRICSRCLCSSISHRPLLSLDFRRHITRIHPYRPLSQKQARLSEARLAWEREKRHSLRTLLIQQYEEEERPNWQRAAKRLETDEPTGESGYWNSRDTLGYRAQQQRHENVQCGIFWDIENVRNETHPPAVVIEAIRDFAGCRHTPVFQAYMSRPALHIESRMNAIYSQLGVTFVQCYALGGKDTADKKIISDMWKFYASFSRSAPDTRIRIILITGDRDFADVIGQLRNLGVEIGILTGSVRETAPVYDDYTIGMRVLPLLGVIQARARDIDLNAYQASRRQSLGEFEERLNGKSNTDDLVNESDVAEKNPDEGDLPFPKLLKEQKETSHEDKAPSAAIESASTPEETIPKPNTLESMSEHPKPSVSVDQAHTVETAETTPASQETKSSAPEKTLPKEPTKEPEKKSAERNLTPQETRSTSHEQTPVIGLEFGKEVSKEAEGQGKKDEQPAPPTEIEAGTSQPPASTKRAEQTSAIEVKIAIEKPAQNQQPTQASAEKQPSRGFFARAQTFFSWFTAPKSDETASSEDKPPPSDSKATPPESQPTPRASKVTHHESQTPPPQFKSTPHESQPSPPESKVTPPESQPASFSTSPETRVKDVTKFEQTPVPEPLEEPPRLARRLTEPISLSSSLFSTTSLIPPPIQTVFNTPPSAADAGNNLINRIPSTSIKKPSREELINHYTKYVLKWRPDGIDGNDMKGIWDAWVKIQERSGEESSEFAIRRTARMALAKAVEISEIRKEERERREEEQRAAKEGNALSESILGGKDKKWYPLTQEMSKEQEKEEEKKTEQRAQEVIQQSQESIPEERKPEKGELTRPDSSKVEVGQQADEDRNTVPPETSKTVESSESSSEQGGQWPVGMDRPIPTPLPPNQPQNYSHRI